MSSVSHVHKLSKMEVPVSGPVNNLIFDVNRQTPISGGIGFMELCSDAVEGIIFVQLASVPDLHIKRNHQDHFFAGKLDLSDSGIRAKIYFVSPKGFESPCVDELFEAGGREVQSPHTFFVVLVCIERVGVETGHAS
jgi:hypothetical protein